MGLSVYGPLIFTDLARSPAVCPCWLWDQGHQWLEDKVIAERNVTRGLAYVLRVEWWLPEPGEEGEEGQGQDEQWRPSVPCAIQTILFTNLEEILNVCKMRGGYVL